MRVRAFRLLVFYAFPGKLVNHFDRVAPRKRSVSEAMKLKVKTTAAVVAWGLLVGAGMSVLHARAARPGDAGSRPMQWPVESPLPLASDRPTLLVFLDLKCPCARATMAELEMILTRCGGRAVARILVEGTESGAATWANDRALANLARFPGVNARLDAKGIESNRFGIATSGHVLLFRPDGRLIYQGGVTGARGHEGANYGRDAVISLILGDEPGVRTFPVFGCPLETAASSARERGR